MSILGGLLVEVRNPRAEAQALLPEGHGALVLDPSPPAVHEGEYSDDPTSRASLPPGMIVVSPVSNGDILWVDFLQEQPHFHQWAKDRWLGPWPRLPALPVSFSETRDALHQLAYFVLSPARHRATTKIGLRFTLGGFGTPFFGSDVQVRIQQSTLVLQRGDQAQGIPITTTEAACEAIGIDYRPDWFPNFRDLLPPADPTAVLPIDEEASADLGELFGFGCSVLAELRARAAAQDRPSLVQIWPEHFDIAIELGDPQRGSRASYGLSLGDKNHPEPYLYVSAWGQIDRANPIWNDPYFNGASLTYSELLPAPDQRLAALDFFEAVRAVLL